MHSDTSPPTLGPAHAVVCGASSQIGFFLLPRLLATQANVLALSRTPSLEGGTDARVRWQQADVRQLPAHFTLPADSTWFHLAGLPLLPHVLQHPAAQSIQRVVAFGSTSRFTKAASPTPQERTLAARLAAAEEEVIRLCEMRGIAWTLLRPTLIYGCGRDQNVTFIQRFIRRFGFFPVPYPGNGLRQPVHAEDLAQACIQVWHCPTTFGQAYNLSGGETLRYREWVALIFASLGRKPRILPIPTGLLRLALRLTRVLPRYRHLTPAMAGRSEQDLCFDHSPAHRDFAYHPRGFREGLLL